MVEEEIEIAPPNKIYSTRSTLGKKKKSLQ
jgi:hypothetical protein